MGKASTGFFVPTAGSTIQIETVGLVPAAGFRDLKVRNFATTGTATFGSTATAQTVFAAADGAAGAPSYTFTNETTLGFYRNAAAQMTIPAGALTINNNGANNNNTLTLTKSPAGAQSGVVLSLTLGANSTAARALEVISNAPTSATVDTGLAALFAANSSTANNSRWMVTFIDNATHAAGTGAGISFEGNVNGITNGTVFGTIRGAKANATANNQLSRFIFALNQNANYVAFNLTNVFSMEQGGQLQALSGGVYGWTASATDPTAALDTGVSRVSAGIIAFGTGAAASIAGTTQAIAYQTFSGANRLITLDASVPSVRMSSGSMIQWSNSATESQTTQDTSISRLAADSIAFGNGTAADRSALVSCVGLGFGTGTAATGQITGSSAIVSVSTPILNLAQTWNAAVLFEGMLFNATQISSNAGSRLLNLQFGSNSAFNVQKNGFTSTVSGSVIGWTSSATDATAALDTGLTRDAAGVVAVSVGTFGNANGSIKCRAFTSVKTTSSVIVSATVDSNTHFNNSGAAGTVTFTLPASAVNLMYSFFVATAQSVTIVGTGAETIRIGASVSTATTGNINNAVVGGYITLICHVVGQWVAAAGTQGAWSVV